MKSIFKDYFYFSRSERNGSLLLILSIMIVLALKYICIRPSTFPETDFTAFKQEIVPLLFKESSDSLTSPIKLFSFDPNSASKEELIQLGIPKKTAQTIVNYRDKGGKFRSKSDLKKIYGLKSSDYDRLEAFIEIQRIEVLPERKRSAKSSAPIVVAVANRDCTAFTVKKSPEPAEFITPSAPPKPLIDINEASVLEWQLLRGIGPAYSKRIVNFREKLGGFHSLEQVAETYGLPDSTFQAVRHQLIESAIFRTIEINTIALDQLKSHPYISWKQARILLKYRKQNGPFQNLEDLKKCKVMDQLTLKKLKPYLRYD